ncbi:NAD(P)/FAD-dependent oxidoreductase [Haloplanus aerogenes]|uniref:Digeranylgeranylglycerophospholipid reductase n=1 Tax=Haloplanus aerogenes TaxID=660522 RepID=A0A3M0CWM7_9EURY|nr:NAD(P)/FAD-dependent oxidoreductase [Haloplanus aerogenes]AZH25174.1 NAD(P)/FAD-dependent oxidoreductase [Haloplanus aerogenes]RMB13598.1 digeranylgeranylglycerophospholipid reductase [Haloplanus aerogenes]
MSDERRRAAILGGSVSGLAMAEGLRELSAFDEIVVFERQEYSDKRVDCGEAINDSTLIPLEKTPENGFVNDVRGFDLRIYEGTDRPQSADPIATSKLRCDPGYICERDRVERRWAERLREVGVEFRTGRSVSIAEYEDIVDAYEYVFDATGQPALTLKARDRTTDYTGDMVALNATVDGDFADYADWPRIFFEGYVGYAWSFPKSATRANVGIGWAGEQRPDDYLEALAEAAERCGFPVPDRSQVNVYTIPRGPSLSPENVYFPDDNVFLIGDAAGIANRYQGEGICQGIRSAYLLRDLLEEGAEATYPERLYELMRSEYRLAHLMRGAWVEHEDPYLLGAVAEALEGLTIDEITRRPSAVVTRLARQPSTLLKLGLNPGILRRVYDAYRDSWEYDAPRNNA